jgi:NitT/TauT family transport system substrate-binding protein
VQRRAALSCIGGGVLAAFAPAIAQSGLPTVRIGALAIDASGEAYYGTDTGIFVANGINPQVSTLTNGAAITAAVIGGTLDVGMANPMQVAGAIARGLPLAMIAPAALYSKRDANLNVVVAKTSPIKSPKDLKGATIATGALGDFNQLSLFAWLEANGVPHDSVHLVELPFGEMGAALQRGTIQAAFITEPFKSDAIRAGEIRDFADTYIAIAPEIAVVVWFTTKEWFQKNPETAKKLLNGIYATARWANTHQQQSGEILAKAAKLDPGVLAGMRRLYFATSNDKRYVEGMLTLAARYGMLQRPITFEEYSPLSAPSS